MAKNIKQTPRQTWSALSSVQIQNTIQYNKLLKLKVQESSAKLTNQRVSYAFRPTSSRLVSMPVIFYLHPSSSIVILVFYLFSTGISEQHE